MDYEQMLAAAQTQRPQSVKNRERFEIPRVSGHAEGDKTVLANLIPICQVLRREAVHLAKFITKELAVPGAVRSSELILGRKISSMTVNEKVKKYADLYVFCSECGAPDTDLIRDKKTASLKCNACGAKKVVRDFV